MSPLRSLGNSDNVSYDDVFAATGKRYNHEHVSLDDVGAYSTSGLIIDVDATKSSSYGGSGTTWTNIASGGGSNFTLSGATYDASEGNGSFLFDGSDDIASSASDYDFSSYNYIFVDISFKASNTTQIHLIFEHSQNWNNNTGGFGVACHTNGSSAVANEHHSNHSGNVGNWDATVGTGWAVYGCQFAQTGSTNRKQYMNGQIVNFDTGNAYANNGSSFGDYPFYIGSRYNAIAPAAGYIGYCRVYGSASEFSASTISDNFDVIKNRYGL